MVTQQRNWKLVYAGADYPLDGPTDMSMSEYFQETRISRAQPGVVQCPECRHWSNVWGAKQVRGFFVQHRGHEGINVMLKPKRPPRRRTQSR